MRAWRGGELVAKCRKIVREHAVSSSEVETAGTKYVISSGLALRQEPSDECCCSCLIQETDHRPHDLLDSLCPDLCAISYPQHRIPYYALRTLYLSLPSPQLASIPWQRLPTLPVPSSTTGICPVSTSAYQIYRLTPSHSIIFPLRLLQRTLTAPLTVSLLLKLVLLLLLSLASLVISVLAVGAFFWTWSAGGPIEVEGWLVYG